MINSAPINPETNKTLLNDLPVSSDEPSVVYLSRLPVVIIENIALKLTLPDLLSFNRTCKYVHRCIGIRIISKIKDRFYYKFSFLSKMPEEKHESECDQLTRFFNGTLHADAVNIKVFHNGKRCINSKELEVVKVDAVDRDDVLFVGSLRNGRKFAFIYAMFRDQADGYKQLTFWCGYSNVYVGDSYKEIIKLIKDNRKDALPRYIDYMLDHKKIYY